MSKLLNALLNLISRLVGFAFLLLLLIPTCGLGLFCLLLPYIIWSSLFPLLSENVLEFVLLIIPALLGSFLGLLLAYSLYGLFFIDDFGKAGTSKGASSSESDKKSKLKDSFFSILIIIIIVVEIGVAYIFPVSSVKNHYFGQGGGNGYSSGYGSSENTNNSSGRDAPFWRKFHFGKKDTSAWDYFEEKNRIGDSYLSISADYSNLTEAGSYGGGALLQATNSLYFSFPALSKSDISNTDQCTGMMGTAKELFGYKDDITVSQLKEDLGLTSETFYDDNLTYKKTSSGGYYYVVILSVDITKDSDTVTPDTWISVVQRNRQIIPVGSLASDQDATRETVFFVEDGNRYHRDSSCSTLHDSDVIYECYLDEVPDGRSECGVCN